MAFMNTYDIDDALQRWESHPVLGPATRTLAELRDAADANSDGWAYWPKPRKAAVKLMELITRDGTNKYFHGAREDATPAALAAALRPIKTFRAQSGLKFEIVEKLSADAADVVTSKKLGDMTPAERDVAVKSATGRFQAELEANAPAITKLLEDDSSAQRDSATVSIDPADFAQVLAALDLERNHLSYQEQAHFVLDWLYKLDPSYSIQRHTDGQLYWLTEQEHAAGLQPGPERRVL